MNIENETQSKKKNNSSFNSSLVYGLAGFLGNLTSGLFYPLELIKIRLQGIIKNYLLNLIFIVDEQNRKLSSVITEVYKKEGIRGFYRGFYYSICASCFSNLLFFSL